MTIRVGMWVVRRPDYLNDAWWRGYCTGVNKKVDDRFLVTYVGTSEIQFAGSSKLASKDKFIPFFPAEIKLEDWM